MDRLDGAAKSEGRLTRRGVIAGAGGLAAAGVVAPGAAAAAAQRVRRLGEPQPGVAAAEVVGEIAQDGNGLTGYGFLTRLAGLRTAALFTAAPHGEVTSRLTYFVHARAAERFPHGVLVAVVGTGRLTIHAGDGGAEFADPGSFAAGRRIATFDARFQHIATVFAPNQAVTRIEGELVQLGARAFALGGHRNRLGHDGMRMRFTATGQGMRTQPVPPRAVFDMAGRFDVVR